MTDAKAIAERRDEHIDGFNRQDVAAMSQTVTHDSITMPPNQAPLIGRAALEAWWKDGFEVAKSTFTYTPQEVLTGESWAYDRFDRTMVRGSSHVRSGTASTLSLAFGRVHQEAEVYSFR